MSGFHGDISVAGVSSMLYLLVIFRLDGYRKTRGIVFPNEFRVYASWWFWWLGVYSSLSVVSMLPVPFLLDRQGSSFCGATIAPSWLHEWVESVTRVFFWSKMVEFGDTVWFILSNRSHVKFLQWFHHLVTLWYVLYNMSWFPMTGCIFGSVNMAVHALMYPYFAFSIHPDRRSSIPIPPILISLAQILQMVVGIATIVFHHVYCRPPVWDWVGGCMFFIYFLLFVEFFMEKYGSRLWKIRVE